MMPWFLAEISGEVITVVAFLLFSLLGWLKDRFFSPKEEEPTFDEEEREVIWKRQVGEEPSEWQGIPEVIEDVVPPPIPVAVEPPPVPEVAVVPAGFEATPYQMPAPPREVPEELEHLAREIESVGVKRRKRPVGGRVGKLLASPSAARDAIVLREVLGTPLGMRR